MSLIYLFIFVQLNVCFLRIMGTPHFFELPSNQALKHFKFRILYACTVHKATLTIFYFSLFPFS